MRHGSATLNVLKYVGAHCVRQIAGDQRSPLWVAVDDKKLKP